MSKYIESAGEILNGINSIFAGITIGKFLKWIITILIITSAVLFLYEKIFTSTFFYDRADRKVEIIKKVKVIGSEDPAIINLSNEKLISVLNNLDSPEGIAFSPYISKDILIKIFGAAIIPFLIVLLTWKDPDRSDAFLGALVFLITFGLLAIIIPVIYNPWVNFSIILTLEILVTIAIVYQEPKTISNSEN